MNIKDIYSQWEKLVDKDIEVCGWLEFKRESNEKFFFIVLRDGSCFNNLQCVCDLSNFHSHDFFQNLKSINRCSGIKLCGKLVKSPAKGQKFELKVIDGTIYGNVADTYPLQKSRLPLDVLRQYPHLRLRTRTFQALTILRNTLQFEVHQFYNKMGFLHIATPLITSNDCEGAGETFDVDKKNKKFFGKDVHLTVSGQLHVETYAGGFEKVYTFGPTFRAENSNTSRHLAEFWMIEPELNFINFDDLQENMELFLKYICTKILIEHLDIIDFFDTFYEKGLKKKLEMIANPQDRFLRKTYYDCLKFLLAEIDCGNIVVDLGKDARRLDNGVLVLGKIPRFGDDFGSEIEKYLVEEFGNKPFFITHFPKQLKSFYMRVDRDNDELMEATDLLVPAVGELMGGSMREEELDRLEQVMEEKGVNKEGLEWYMDMRKYGSVPHGGYGIGFERLICFITGMKNIKDVIPFYRAPNNCFA